MATYKQSDRLKELGKKVIKENERFAHLDSEECRIAYQYSSNAKTSRDRLVYADTEVVKEKLKGLIPYDFIITFYEPNCQPLSEEKMERLMYHELCHVGFKGLGKYSIIPHDVEDFRDVIDACNEDSEDEDTLPGQNKDLKTLNTDSIDRIVRERVKVGLIGRKINLDGLEDLSLKAAKKAVIRAVRPSIRLDGKSNTFINALYECCADDIKARDDGAGVQLGRSDHRQ